MGANYYFTPRILPNAYFTRELIRTMRLLSFIHEQITIPAAKLEANNEQMMPEVTGEHEIKEETENNNLIASGVTNGI